MDVNHTEVFIPELGCNNYKELLPSYECALGRKSNLSSETSCNTENQPLSYITLQCTPTSIPHMQCHV